MTPTSTNLIDAQRDLAAAAVVGPLRDAAGFRFEVRAGRQNVWVVVSREGEECAALRTGLGGEIGGVSLYPDGADHVCEFRSALGSHRVRLSFPLGERAVLHSTASVWPERDFALSSTSRDLFALSPERGTVHASQRGLRTGIVFASVSEPSPLSLFYVQDFSPLSAFFERLKKSPADTVGGEWPELGFLPPAGEDCVLQRSLDHVYSSSYLVLSPKSESDAAAIAGSYLDNLAVAYLAMPAREVSYRDWPERAAKTLRDLSFSPACSHSVDGHTYLFPYVNDTTKPAESMVQLTVLVNALEYDEWIGRESLLTRNLKAAVPTFFNPEFETVVRWLPGANFGVQAEEHMDHETMDSWYLYHSLFNIARLARLGDAAAQDAFRRSLPFATRVAHRFNYRWPVFFSMKSLDAVRAESAPGAGGETDVGGLYAAVMLEAYELFEGEEYLAEAKSAAERLADRGFNVAYQMNTTAFGAQSMMRLWKMTGERKYLELSEMCLASIFDNVWLWGCSYGHGKYYETFFGMFPLHDAPYLSAFEELEVQVIFHEYLKLGGDDVRSPIKLLLAEFQKYCLDRAWFYYPDALPVDALATKARNGSLQRALSVPIEDLQDGRELSGQVGQEIYGSGLAFVYASRYFRRLDATGTLAFCNYPLFDWKAGRNGRAFTFRVGGDRKKTCELRIVPTDPNLRRAVSVMAEGGKAAPVEGRLTTEGHQSFALRGGQSYTLHFVASAASSEKMPRRAAHASSKSGKTGRDRKSQSPPKT